MTHPLAEIMQSTDRFLLIGDASENHFPGSSYHAYTVAKKPFYCLDLGGLTTSRGKTKGGKVYTSVAELPEDRADLAIIWMKPRSAVRAVDAAHEAGCKRVWFSFGTGHPTAIARARELGMEVVEIGRCPVYYLEGDVPLGCKLHIAGVKLSGLYRKPPYTDPDQKRREML